MMVLTEKGGFSLPAMPPELNDHGKPIISIAKFQGWLAERAEERDIEIITATAGNELLYNEAGEVMGVRTRDRGIDHHGNPKDEFEPGSDVHAKVTIIGEGPRGHLARQLFDKFNLFERKNPITYEMGCKEVLELPKGSV